MCRCKPVRHVAGATVGPGAHAPGRTGDRLLQPGNHAKSIDRGAAVPHLPGS
jgi:hypothetical protein